MRRFLLAAGALLLAASAGGVAAPPVHAVDATAPAAVPAGCQAVTDLAAAGWVDPEPAGTHLFCSYSTQGLTRTYWVFEPADWVAGDTWPMVVVLHGCTEQGPDIAALSRFSWEASSKHLLVVYPDQAGFTMTGATTFDGNGSHCWNWFLPQGQARGAGEPALIAGITQTAQQALGADAARTYVLGVSAGGATADIMAATYPDVFAAGAMLAGCEYRGLPCFGSVSAEPPQVSGQWAYQAPGARARVVPFVVENGDTDPVVPLPNAISLTQQWQVTDDLAAHGGTASSPVPSAPCAHSQYVPASPIDSSQSPPAVTNPYDILYYSLDGSPCPAAVNDPSAALGELWIVHGEFHAWPGGPPLTVQEPYTNPGGPNFTDAVTDFFLAHPCRLLNGACAPGV